MSTDIQLKEPLQQLLNILKGELPNNIIIDQYKDLISTLNNQDLLSCISFCLPSISENGETTIDRSEIISFFRQYYSIDQHSVQGLLYLVVSHLKVAYNKKYNSVFSNILKSLLKNISFELFNLPILLFSNNKNLMEYIYTEFYSEWIIKDLYDIGVNLQYVGSNPTPFYIFCFKHEINSVKNSDEDDDDNDNEELDLFEKNKEQVNFLIKLGVDFNNLNIHKLFFICFLYSEYNIGVKHLDYLKTTSIKNDSCYSIHKNLLNNLFYLNKENMTDYYDNNLSHFIKHSLLFEGPFNLPDYNLMTPSMTLIKRKSYFYIQHYLEIDIGWNIKNFENKTAFDLIENDEQLKEFINTLFSISEFSILKPFSSIASIHNQDYLKGFLSIHGVNEFNNSDITLLKDETIYKDIVKNDLSNTVFFQHFYEWLENTHIETKNKIITLVTDLFNEKYPLPVIVEEDIYVELYTNENFKKFKKDTEANKEDNHPKIAEKFLKFIANNPDTKHKILAKSSNLFKHIDILYEKFPHFKEVLVHLSDYALLQSKGDSVFYIPPMLMAGGPGVGKTFFSHELAEIVKTYFYVFNMESMTNAGILTGLSDLWAGAGAGKIFNVLRDEKTMNPIFLLDEIDKSGGLGRNSDSVTNSLLPLLERYTASKFTDECIPLPIDASHIVWFATANNLDMVSAPIKSRFDIFNIPSPNFTERKALIKGVYNTILEKNSWGKIFNKVIPDASLDLLASVNTPGAARDLRRNLTIACSRAVKNNRTEIHIEDLSMLINEQKMPWDIILDNQPKQNDNIVNDSIITQENKN